MFVGDESDMPIVGMCLLEMTFRDEINTYIFAIHLWRYVCWGLK